MLMLGALERGLSLRDFEDLTLGMLLDYIITYNNDRLNDADGDTRETVRQATQADFDRF
jgi:hypothetical protein